MTSKIKPQFRLTSSWSKAGIGTCMVVDVNELGTQRIVFDIGSTPIFHYAITASFVFISHGHLDHIGGIFSHARAHSLSCSTTPTYYVPESLVSKLEQARDAMLALDSAHNHDETTVGADIDASVNKKRNMSLMSMNIIGVKAGQEFIFQPKKCGKLFARTFAVDHGGHPSIGYVIGRTVSGGLLPQYEGLAPPDIGKLIKAGTQVKADPIEVLEVAYTGDTCASGLQWKNKFSQENLLSKKEQEKSVHHLRQAFQSSLILCELTFIDSLDTKSRSLADKSGHLHIDDVQEILVNHGWNVNNVTTTTHNEESHPIQTQTLVFFHLSHRYGPASRALDLIVNGLPPNMLKFVHVSISSFISNETNQKESVVKKCLKENGCISLLEYVEARCSSQG